MNDKRRDVAAQSLAHPDQPTLERCACLPLSPLQSALSRPSDNLHDGQGDDLDAEVEKVTPATQELNARIRRQLSTCFPRSTPLSLLLLHVSQQEHVSITPQSAILRKRQRYHAPVSFLEQVLVNVRRVIRSSDQLLIDQGTGVALIFPGVDQPGIQTILERIYRSVSLLRAETVIPPLKRETDIVIGIGSHLEAGTSLEHLLSQTRTIARKLTLRPAIASHFWGVMSPLSEPEEILLRPPQEYKDATRLHQGSSVPFMELPTQLPRRLKQLIPYHIALELHCAPVGRDHHCLTVAMADPTNKNTIRLLEEITSLIIFPVSCDVSALNALLANKW